MSSELIAGIRTNSTPPESDQELREFIENFPIALHWVAADGTILWANQTELRMLGYTADEYIGHNIVQFHMDELVILDMLERLKSRQELHNYEARLRCKDGSARPVAIDSNVYFRKGEFVHTRCVTHDLMGESTSVLQGRLAAIVESSDDAIISKDLGGIIRSWNGGAQRIFGYTAEEAVGQHISMLAVPDRIDEIPNILARLARGERVDHYQTKRKTKDGRVLSISLTVSPIRDANGTIIGASKVARDVTNQVRTEEELRAANESLLRSNADLEHFAYSASHDLQEPLRMVASYSDLLQMKFGETLGATGESYIRFITGGAVRMEQLLRDLRTFAQISNMTPEPSADADANSALDRALANLATSIAESGAAVTHDPLPCVRVHDFQLQQLFQNLIGNAIRYRRDDPPKIHISAERGGRDWKFSVQDNGIGIDPQYKEQIFGMFKRLHTNADYPGTGMGLAICERIVQRTGGRIWVESEAGRGSTFLFTLPAGRNC